MTHLFCWRQLQETEYFPFLPTWHPPVPTRQPRYNWCECRQWFIKMGNRVMGAIGMSQAQLWLSDGWDWSKEERNNQGIEAEPPGVLESLKGLSTLQCWWIDLPALPPWNPWFVGISSKLTISFLSPATVLPSSRWQSTARLYQVYMRCLELLTGF